MLDADVLAPPMPNPVVAKIVIAGLDPTIHTPTLDRALAWWRGSPGQARGRRIRPIEMQGSAQ